MSFADPFYSALALIGNLASLAVLYLLLSAEFVAAAQVLIYAGAIVVMFLFVIAYVGGRADAPWAGSAVRPDVGGDRGGGGDPRRGARRHRRPGGRRRADDAADISAAFGGPAAIGELFLTDHLLAFEITSVVLLVAAVGGVILGSHARRLRRGGRLLVTRANVNGARHQFRVCANSVTTSMPGRRRPAA